MGFIYPRTVTFARPTLTGRSAGVQPVQEFTPSQDPPYAKNVPCSIQQERDGGMPLGALPGDTRARGVWRIMIAQGEANACGIGTPDAIRDRDFATDDAGSRYQCTHAYWNSLGWNLKCERLEA